MVCPDLSPAVARSACLRCTDGHKKPGQDILVTPANTQPYRHASLPLAPRVVAVVVVYLPDMLQLRRLLRALAPQVASGCIVHNGPHLPDLAVQTELEGFTVVHLGANFGVASALNAGFAWAQENQADYVVSFDQDSEPATGMVERLLHAFAALTQLGQKVGAVGPQQVDWTTGQAAPFIAPIAGPRRRIFPLPGDPLEVDHLITSGCLVPMTSWTMDGHFMDALFIDYVDIEWCLRLRSRGWKMFGVGDAHLMHSIGEGVKRIGRRQVAWHGPLRHYYIFRNAVFLQHLPYIYRLWKISDVWQLLKKFVFFALVARPRGVHVRAMVLGIRDGWHGQLGPSNARFD